MGKLRTVILFASLCISPVAFGKAPSGQGRVCSANNKCDAALRCVAKRGGKSTCEVVCATNTSCPEDQRCVADDGAKVCRPITDLDL
jgi:hypothetical protein